MIVDRSSKICYEKYTLFNETEYEVFIESGGYLIKTKFRGRETKFRTQICLYLLTSWSMYHTLSLINTSSQPYKGTKTSTLIPFLLKIPSRISV